MSKVNKTPTKKKPDAPAITIIATNRKAHHNYAIDDSYEAGIVLRGTEIKAIREKKVDLKDGYGSIKNGECFVHQLHIGEYLFGNINNHEPLRVRKLLLHKSELNKIIAKMNAKGYTLIPLKLYLKNGKAKIEIGLAKGKKSYDKKEAIKKRDMDREMRRAD